MILADRLVAHKFLGDYTRQDVVGADKHSASDLRMEALRVLVEEAEDMEASMSVLNQKMLEQQEEAANSVWDGGDEAVKATLFTRLGWAAFAFAKRLTGTAAKWAWGGARFLGRHLIRFLIRGILMPVGGAVVSVLGWPVTLGLALGGIATYLIYKVWGSDAAQEEAIKAKYSGLLQTGTSQPTPQQSFAGSYVSPTDQQVVTTTEQQRQAISRAPSGGTAPTPTGNGVKEFIASIDPQLIEIGKANCFLADSGVDIAGMNQDFMTIFYGMVGDWVQQGGSKVRINSAYRDIAKQKRLYDAWIARGRTGGAVARPGRSRHQRGVALDIASVSANGMARKGLLRKYKFIRPVRGEAWHLENLLFGSGAATAKAVEEAKKEKAIADKPTKVKAADEQWLEKMKETPDAPAAADYPDQAKKHPDVYYDERGKPRSYKEIYNRSQATIKEKPVEDKPQAVEVPKKKPTTQGPTPRENEPKTSVGDEAKQPQWIKKKGKLIQG